MTSGFSRIAAFFMALLTALFGVGSAPWTMGADDASSALFEGFPEELAYPLRPYYREGVTRTAGEAAFDGDVGIRLSYTSEFYGHESLINRDFTRYGERYDSGFLSGMLPPAGELAVADCNGDGIGDVLQYKMGVLSVFPVRMLHDRKETPVVEGEMSFKAGRPEKIRIGFGLHLCGAGDLNGDGYHDILFAVGENIVVYFGSGDGFKAKEYELGGTGFIRCGDVDGDGVAEILAVSGNAVSVWSVASGAVEKTAEKEAAADVSEPDNIFAADVNSDGLCDLVYQTTGNGTRFSSFFGRGDGRFGSYEEDNDNKNLYAVFETKREALRITIGDITGNGAADIVGAFSYLGVTTNRVLYACDEPAYDYSMFGMLRDGEYRIYSGCRWADANVQGGDGDHVMLTVSDDGVHWRRRLEAPMFLLGKETGEEGWWTDNTLEPEVLYVNGTYHMYWQCSFTTPNGNYGDKIGYASSADGVHWERKTDAPAILCDDPEIGFNHEEVLYVADDPDGKPFWMYTGHFINDRFSGYVRIRSARPDRFLYSDAEATGGFAQIGNQLAYTTDENGDRIFLRVTFFDTVEKDGKTYARPTLFLSRDGLHFTASPDCVLAGVDVTDERTRNNRNMYFLGLVTLDGTGEIPRGEDGTYELMYLSTTSNSPGGFDIFKAEAGYGVVYFSIGPFEE